MNTLSREEVERRKAQAVRFTRDVLDDPDRAEEIEDEALEDYAARRHIKIVNPKGAKLMAVRTRRELLDTIRELEEQNDELQGQLDEIKEIVGEQEEEEEGE